MAAGTLAVSSAGEVASSAASTARISGRVVDERGRPIPNFIVNVHEVVRVDQEGLSTVTRTKADGTYTIPVRPGIYRLELEHYEADFDYRRPFVEKWWPNSLEYVGGVDVIAPSGAHVRGVDAVMQRGAVIRGTTTDATGLPVVASISSYRRHGERWENFDAGRWVADDGSGRFEISGLPPGTYRLEARGDDGQTCSVQSALAGPSIKVRASEVVSGRVLDLVPRGSIHGTVQPVDEQASNFAELQQLTSEFGWVRVVEPAQIGPDHEFRFEDLCPGRYRLSFGEPLEYWNDAADFASADDIVVRPGEDVAVSAELQPGGTISGRVLLPGGDPAGWLSVMAHRRAEDGSWESVRGTGTAADGSFAITDVRPGTYRLQFGTQVWDDADQPIAREYWEDAPDIENAAEVVVPSTTAVMEIGDAHVARGAEVFGEVHEAVHGDVLGNATVFLLQHNSDGWAVVDKMQTPLRNGQYHFVGLVPGGRYRLAVVDTQRQEHATEFWPTAHTWAAAQDLVLEPNEIEQVDFDLDLTVRNLARPKVMGKPRVGAKLRVMPGIWSPFRLDLKYRWLVGGKPIRGAHGRTFRPSRKHVGKRVSVRVRGVRPGYVPLTATTALTGRVRR